MIQRGKIKRTYSNGLSIYETLGREQPFAIWKGQEILGFFHDLKDAIRYCTTGKMPVREEYND